jgi:hypothetical protein
MHVSGLLTLTGSFTFGERTLVPPEQEAGWTTVSVWKFWRGGILPMPGIQSRIVHPIVWAIYWLYYPGIHLWGLRKTTNSLVRMASTPTKIWTWHLLNTSQKHHHFTQFIQYIWGNIQNATHQEEQPKHLPARESNSGCTSSWNLRLKSGSQPLLCSTIWDTHSSSSL